jgi:hypothetical protein
MTITTDVVSSNPRSCPGVLDTTLCDKACQRLATGLWFSLGTSVSSTNKTVCHDIDESGAKHHKPNQTINLLTWSGSYSGPNGGGKFHDRPECVEKEFSKLTKRSFGQNIWRETKHDKS